ncbi:MAG: DUF2793 domain-containing protein [Porphyrobacter sp.]|jgi:hypothetical protein|nr:DUF2793 domain-containing protein [Porphyrobacter sp.]
MSAFADYPAITPGLGLPLLYVGQAQKEFFVNQSLSVLDALIGQSVAAGLAEPPAEPQAGDCYRVVAPAGGPWAGRENQLAIAIGGDWHFVVPPEGSLIFDRALGQFVLFDGDWQLASLPLTASGGTVVDAEARALLAQVIDALVKLGLVAGVPA